MITIELNEYIEKFSEIKPLLEQEVDRTLFREALIVNDGVENIILAKVIKYLEDRDFQVTVESKNKGAANRLNALFGCAK